MKFQQDILQTISEACAFIDPSYVHVYANEAYGDLYNKKPNEIIGQKIQDITGEAHFQKRIRPHLDQCLNGEKISFDYILPGGDGEIESHLSMTYTPHYSDGEFDGIILNITERKEAEEELVTQKAYLERLFESAPEGIAILDNDDRIQKVNHEFTRMFGYTSEESVGKRINDLIVPEEYKEEGQGATNNVAKGKSVKLETIRQHKNGKMIFVSILGNPIRLKNRQLGVYGIYRDITIEKQAVNDLKESQLKLKNIVENSTNLFFAHTTDHVITYLSPQVSDYLGYEPEEAMKRWTEFVTDNPINKEGFKHTEKAIKTGKQQPNYELELQSKDGSKLIVEVREIPVVENGKVVSIVGSLVDITDRKEAEKRLLDSERRFRTLVSTLPDYIWLKNTEGVYLNCNPKFEEFFGHKESEIIGKTDYEFVPKELADLFRRKDNEAILAGKPNTNEEEVVRALDSRKIILETTKTPMFAEDGSIIGVLGIGHDITERKQTENKLKEAKIQAEESDRLKSAFLTNMSHEIRTPMNGILGFTDLLDRDDFSAEKKSHFIDIIRKSGDRLINTINDLIDISQIESGLVNLDFSIVDIKAEVEDIYTFFQPEAQKKGLELFLIKPLKDIDLTGKTDLSKFQSILTNLIKNAIKFTDKGKITIEYSFRNNTLEFRIQDTGIGIPEDRLDSIFDRFIQADVSNTRPYEGSGLGLSITKAYVEMLGGEIVLKSQVGEGSTFTFTLPFKTKVDTSNASAISQEETFPKISNLKVLIVEDDITSAEFLKELLKAHCKTLDFAKNGHEAVEKIRQNGEFDIILMDIKMPLMDGYEATRRIREFNKDITIIAQTAYALTGDHEEAMRAGCDGYIAKPIKEDDFLRLIREVHFKKE